MTEPLHEEHETLWVLAFPPIIWAAHFLLSYCTAAIWCAKYAGHSGSLQGARIAIAVYTLLALAGLTWCGRRGHQRHAHMGGDIPHDADTPEDRHRFLGFATLLLAGLSAIATLYAAWVAVFIRSCW